MNGGQFNVHTREVSKWLHGLPGLNEPLVKFLPSDVRGMNELYVNGMNELSTGVLSS